MKGKLTDQPLAELIREISFKGLSGTLRLEHELAQTAIYFEQAQIVFAASNIRRLRLREYLTKRAIVTEKELATLGNNLSDPGLAAILVAKRFIRQEDAYGLLATLVTDVLRVALLWTEGAWEFDERARLEDPARIRVDTGNLLREAAQRMPMKFVSLRFRNPKELISRAAVIPDIDNFLPAESFILSRLDEPTRLDELVAISGLSERDAHRIIYGLALSGLVKREYWQNAFRTGSAEAPGEPAASVARTDVPRSEPQTVEGRWGAETGEDELTPFFDRLKEATTHYEVMDLPARADTTEIKDAYYALARRYHPDRFHLKSGTRLHGQISSAFARITQAYETLTDPNARATYDLSLQRAKQFSDSAPKSGKDKSVSAATDDFEFDVGAEGGSEKGEYHFREGFGALQQGRITAAVSHLAAASRMAPHEARYRAYYGRALAANEPTRRLAESEIQAAVKLEPNNVKFRIMLAELYFDLNFHRRAQTELERALSLDPESASAHSLKRKLERSRKTS